MRFVPLKSVEQQDLQALHRTRDRLIVQRTALINHTRGLLAEYGVVMPAGASRFRLQVDKMIEIAELSHLAKDLFLKLVEEYRDLDARVSTLDDMLEIGRAHVCTPVNNAQLVCRHLLENTKRRTRRPVLRQTNR